MLRKYIRFYGMVQGVGFRYKSSKLAVMYEVTGFVRNMEDGTVEMEAEGREEDIDMMINGLYTDNYINIEKMEVHEITPEGSRYFEIRE